MVDGVLDFLRQVLERGPALEFLETDLDALELTGFELDVHDSLRIHRVSLAEHWVGCFQVRRQKNPYGLLLTLKVSTNGMRSL